MDCETKDVLQLTPEKRVPLLLLTLTILSSAMLRIREDGRAVIWTWATPYNEEELPPASCTAAALLVLLLFDSAAGLDIWLCEEGRTARGEEEGEKLARSGKRDRALTRECV